MTTRSSLSRNWQLTATSNPASIIVQPRFHRMDFSMSGLTEAKILALAEKGKRRIVLDLAKVHFIDSCMLGTLVELHTRLGETGEISFCNVAANVKRVLEMTRLDEVFPIYENLDTLPREAA
jgi:anti-anti-sigma factor